MPASQENRRDVLGREDSAGTSGVTQNQLSPSDSGFISHLQGELLNRRLHLCREGSKERGEVPARQGMSARNVWKLDPKLTKSLIQCQ